MDHVDGEDPFAVTLPLVALGLGATVLEKHMTLDRADKGTDYYSSLNPEEFKQFILCVRRMEKAINGRPEDFTPSEKRYRAEVKKHWVAKLAMPKGHVIEPGEIVMKRASGSDLQPVTANRLVGRSVIQNVQEDEPLTAYDVDNTVWALVVARMRSTRLPGKALLLSFNIFFIF